MDSQYVASPSNYRKFLVISRFPTNFNFLSFKKKKNHFPSPLTKILGYYVSTRMYPEDQKILDR